MDYFWSVIINAREFLNGMVVMCLIALTIIHTKTVIRQFITADEWPSSAPNEATIPYPRLTLTLFIIIVSCMFLQIWFPNQEQIDLILLSPKYTNTLLEFVKEFK